MVIFSQFIHLDYIFLLCGGAVGAFSSSAAEWSFQLTAARFFEASAPPHNKKDKHFRLSKITY